MIRAEILDIKALERIVAKMINTIEKSQGQIFDIAENARKEYTRMQIELQETKIQANELIQTVDKMEKVEKQTRLRLAEVSRDFSRYTEEDIREAYENAKNIQIQLSVLREKEANLRQRRDELERRIKSVEEIVKKAEALMSQVGMMLKFISGNLQDVSDKLNEFQKRQQLGWWVIQAQEDERKRVAREIHDGTAQSLTSIFLRLEFCEKMWDLNVDRVRQELIELKDVVRENLQDLRKIIFDLRPQALDDLGLIPTLKHYITDYEERYHLPVRLIALGLDKRLEPYLEVTLFRLIQEALTNIRKHAQASDVSVKIEISRDFVIAQIKDNGRGFDLETVQNKAHDSYGLIHMRERVELIGGEFSINTRPGRGTEVLARIPFNNKEGFNSRLIM